MSERSFEKLKPVHPLASYLMRWLYLVLFIFWVFPIGALALLGGRLVYGSWRSAGLVYVLGGLSGIISILGTIPVLGVWLHWLAGERLLMPWVAEHGVAGSWLTGFLLSSGSLVAVVCWSALSFRFAEAKDIPAGSASVPSDLQKLGLPFAQKGTQDHASSRFLFWFNLMTVIVGLGMILWLYRSWPSCIVVVIFLVLFGFGVLRRQ